MGQKELGRLIDACKLSLYEGANVKPRIVKFVPLFGLLTYLLFTHPQSIDAKYEQTTAKTTRVSINSNGSQGNYRSGSASISANGRYVAFESAASNLVSGDTNSARDVFVHDRQTQKTDRVSISSKGIQANDDSYFPSISGNGRYVAFTSLAGNLAKNDANYFCDGPERCSDVYLHDRETGETIRVSVNSSGKQGNDESSEPSISSDGRYVTFTSRASNLVANDTNGVSDIFVHDRMTLQTTRVSLSSNQIQSNDFSSSPSISSEGRYIAFASFATNLVSNDTNNYCAFSWTDSCPDIFVHDRQTGITTLISLSTNGIQGNDLSTGPFISADGRYVSFSSNATNLVNGDTNNSCDSNYDGVFAENCADAFVHDRDTGETIRISVADDGTEGNGWSSSGSISTDGRYMVFSSSSSNLVSDDTNYYCDLNYDDIVENCPDVFVRDFARGKTTRVSIATNGTQGNGESESFSISGNGQFIAFSSYATNLVKKDTNGDYDVFVHDRGPLPIGTEIDYFALGDSIASGHGLNDDGPECHQSHDRAYPALVASKLLERYDTVNFHFLACSGASALKPDDGSLAKDRYKWLRNQVHDAAQKIRSLPKDRPILITINIGANDFGWARKRIVVQLLKPFPLFTNWADNITSKVADEVKTDVQELLLAHRKTAIVITELYNPVNQESVFFQVSVKKDKCAVLTSFEDCYNKVEYGVDQLNNTLRAGVIDKIQKPKRLTMTGTLRDLFRGHGAPKLSCGSKGPTEAKSWIQWIGYPNSNSILPPPFDGLGSPGDCFHPNDIGAAKYAEAVNNLAITMGR